MPAKDIIRSQYLASLEMLSQAILQCPEELWEDARFPNQFWQIAYHVLFYTHLYLQPTEEDFIPWENHKDGLVSLGDDPGDEIYSKEEILAYLDHFEGRLGELVDQTDLGAESGFHWLPFNKMQLQFYNIRHFQQHTGELCERLWKEGGIEVSWVGMVQD